MARCHNILLCALRQDDDPYVRKTAAVCVAKLYDINPELVEDRGFLDLLKARPYVLIRPPWRSARRLKQGACCPAVLSRPPYCPVQATLQSPPRLKQGSMRRKGA